MCKEIYIRRCFDLARLAGKSVKFNPQVGAVYVKKGRILTEGYHETYGSSHAERRAIERSEGKDLAGSEVFVSLEPCSHFGKTPPCADLLIASRVTKVHIATKDPNPAVNGRGIARLLSAGISVEVDKRPDHALKILSPFLTTQLLKRPFVVLKWAESTDGFIARQDARTKISNPITDRLVHKWRAESDAIMIGTNTALIDNPTLTTRLYPGESPLRVLIDRRNRIPIDHNIFTDGSPTLLFSYRQRDQLTSDVEQIIMPESDIERELDFMLSGMYDRGISRLLVEGGSQLLQSFLAAGKWDVCQRIRSTVILKSGVKAPPLDQPYEFRTRILEDVIDQYRHSLPDRSIEAEG